MNKKYQFTFHHGEDGNVIAIIISRRGKSVSLSPQDFSVKGNQLTLNKNPEEYFKVQKS